MQPVPAGYLIEELSGPFIVACLLNWGLFGTLSVQLCVSLQVVLPPIVSNAFSLDLYYLAFPNDRRFTKHLVYGIYVIEFVQTMLVAHDMFATYGYGFGDMDALTGMNFNWLTVPIMSAVAACVGQIFYAYRIFILSKSRIISIFVICVSLTSSVAAMITGIYSFQAGNVTKLNNRKTSIAVGIWCGTSALCDILIAICMTYYLMRNNTTLRHTRMLITKLIRLIIETGSVTAAVALLNLILFFAFPHQTFYTTPALLMPKLYANTVYMVLNSRFRIIGGRDTYMSSNDMSITTTMIRDITSRPADGMQRPASVVAISNEEFNDNYEISQTSDKPQDGCISLPA
ncbi:hypothetical protein ARMGADRAFT_1069822 [Armillaria gallica]|uniref:DUF6534 domain-containing protein n=1 Tax=Armillaria gallica TaxID=47427 RepID=A0A2H3EIV5_ARMGA|nr:hypothetical protein ARMGADRAFT_1069822 [Armillaria gallica]